MDISGRLTRLMVGPCLGLMVLLAGVAAGQARDMSVSVGGREIKIVLDRDQCQLERTNPSDKRVYEVVERGLVGNNQLLALAADCTQIPAWRKGERATLDDFTQVQVALKLRNQDMTGRESEAPKQICAALRTQGEALVQGPVKAVRERFNSVSKDVKLNETKLLGVVFEDSQACYAALVQRVRTEQGVDKQILAVFAHVVLRGRLLYLYRFTQGESVESLLKLTDLMRQSVQVHLAANR